MIFMNENLFYELIGLNLFKAINISQNNLNQENL